MRLWVLCPGICKYAFWFSDLIVVLGEHPFTVKMLFGRCLDRFFDRRLRVVGPESNCGRMLVSRDSYIKMGLDNSILKYLRLMAQ